MGRSDLTIPMHYYHLLSLIVCLGSCAAKSVTKTYLVETNDGELNFEPEPKPEEFGDDYGHHGNHWTPRPYGHTPTPETARIVTCGTSTSNRSRSCDCTDGVSRPSECGSGSTTDSRTNNHGPCTTKAPVWTPKPYRRRRN